MNLADHGVRKYDSDLGRFLCPDAMWEKYISYSPYHYCRNNPINAIDFNGMDDGSFGNFLMYGSILKQEVKKYGQDLTTVQDIVANSDKPENKQLINTWAEIGMMGLSGIATEAVLSTKVARSVLSKAGNFIKGLLGFGEDAEKGMKSFFDGAKYSSKVLDQMNKTDDILHAFPKSADGFAAKFGQYTTKLGGDGKTYHWLKIPASYDGKTGVFEYTKDANGIINHRFFRVIP